MTTKEIDTKAVFMKKLSDFRADLVQKDWTPTGVMRMGSGPATKYISISQMKANLAPLFSKHGLEFKVEMRKPEALPTTSTSMSHHWMVTLDVSITDIDHPEECESYVFYGEGADSLDKGIAKATTYALKTMLATVFLIADGIDPESDETPEIKSTFVPKSATQTQELKEKIATNATKPKDPFFEKKEESKPVVEKPSVPTPAPAESPVELSPIYRKAVDRTMSEHTKRHEENLETSGQLQEVTDAYKSIKTTEDAKAFIKKYKVN